MNFRGRIRELYEGQSDRTRWFLYGLLAFDLLSLLFIIATSFSHAARSFVALTFFSASRSWPNSFCGSPRSGGLFANSCDLQHGPISQRSDRFWHRRPGKRPAFCDRFGRFGSYAPFALSSIFGTTACSLDDTRKWLPRSQIFRSSSS